MGRVWRRLGPAMVCSLVALAISRVALADDATLIVPSEYLEVVIAKP